MVNSAQAAGKRLILCDPVCVLRYGHNVAAMVNFREFVGRYYDSVTCLSSRYLPSDIADANKLEREFDFYYNDAIPLSDSSKNESYLEGHEQKIRAAKSDFLNLLKRHKVSKDDVLCYPSIDFYSLYAIVESIEELKKAGRPSLLIRLIGVMETAVSGAYAKQMNVLLALLNRLLSADLPVHLAAETPRYADFLAAHLECIVNVAPNIETREQLPLPDNGRFTVVCPGSARYDKGFLDLHEIFTKVRHQDPDVRIRFQTQRLPDRDLKHHLDYLRRLYAVPGVEVLPSQVSADQIKLMYEKADLVLLPYARDVYEFRGSAVLIEATCSGRHALALDGPAFVDQMRYFGSGTACANLTDMADKVVEFSRQSPQLRYAKARQARERFSRDLEDSYRHWVGAV